MRVILKMQFYLNWIDYLNKSKINDTEIEEATKSVHRNINKLNK